MELPRPSTHPTQSVENIKNNVPLTRFNGWVEVTAYLDESYWSPSQGAGPHFYILAMAVMTGHQDENFKWAVAASGGLPFHTTEEARSLDGKLRLMELLEEISNLKIAIEVFFAPVGTSDRLAEQARASLLKDAVLSLKKQGNRTPSVVYDRRLPGYQQNSDARAFASMRSSGLIDRHAAVAAKSASMVDGLVAADAVAWAYRQHHLGNTSMYWHLVQQN
jgi:hypothetical protein